MDKIQSSTADMQDIQCWVPNCTISNKSRKLFSLPDNQKSREVWLALAGKVVTSPQEKINFCSEHFSATEILKIDNSYLINSLPFKNMPQKVCRLCLSIIESDDVQVDSVHVLSNNISTEMPPCIEEILSYFVPSNAEPLLKIVKFCISELDIQCNPPPILCQDCFLNVWLLYMFKISSNEVEKTLREGIPLESYIKMMLCRCCPVRSGTNFLVVPEDSGKGQLLRKIFGEDSNQKNLIPLRLCRKCYEVISKLEDFYKTCQIAEAKIKRHIDLERDNAQRRNTLNEFRRMQENRRQDIAILLDSNQKMASSLEQEICEDGSMGLSKCFTVEPTEKTQISLSQWMKETLAKTLIKHGQNLKNGNDQATIFKNWSLIRGEMVKNGVTLEVPAMMNIWSEMLSATYKKCQMKLPMDYLDELIVQYFKGEDHTLFNESCMVHSISSSGTISKSNVSTDNNSQALEPVDITIPSCSFQSNDYNINPPLLSPQVMPQTISSASKKGCPKDLFWNESRKLIMLELIEKEAVRLKHSYGHMKNPTWEQVIKNFLSKYPEFQKYTTASIRYRIKEWKKELEKGLYADAQHMKVLKRIMSLLDNSNKFTKSVKLQNRKLPAKLPRKSFTEEEKIALAKEMSKEYQILEKYNQLKGKSTWHFILSRLHKRRFLNMKLSRMSALWTKIKMSAKIYSKDGGDEVDTLVWNLLQSFQNHIEIKSKSKPQHCEVDSTNNVEDQDSRQCVGDSSTKFTCNQKSSDIETSRDGADEHTTTESSDNHYSPESADNQDSRNSINNEGSQNNAHKLDSRNNADKQDSQDSAANQHSQNSSLDNQNFRESAENPNFGDNTITKFKKESRNTKRYDDSGSNYEPTKSESEEDDDRFEENFECKPSIKMESSTKYGQTPISRKLDFDKFKFVKAMKREFREMCIRKEAGLHKPFFKIIYRLAEKEYSKFSPHDLQNKWRNMKGAAVSHQKKGTLTKLDRAILGLVSYKNEHSTYEDKSNNFSEDSDNEKRYSSTDSEGADGEDSEFDDKQEPLNVTKLLLDNKPFLKTIKKKLKLIFIQEPGKVTPFRAVFQQLSNNTKEFDLLREKWQKLKDAAYKNRNRQKTTEVDEKVLKLVMLSRSQKTQHSIAGIINTSEADTKNVGNDFLPKIDHKVLLKAILREFDEVIKEEQRFKSPITEALIRVNKKEYYVYRLNEIERKWANIQQNAFKHRKNGTMTEEDETFFYIINTSQEYRKKKNITDKISLLGSKDCGENSKQKIVKLDYSQPSTSTERTGLTIGSNKKSRKHWSEEDLLTLFKLIKREYNACLKTRIPLPSNPWPTIIKRIAENKLFKCSEEKELNHLWLKMRRDFTHHENTIEMTNLDWKVSRLLQRHMANKGIIIKEKEPVVPKQRPRPKFVAESDNEEMNETLISKEETSNKLKLDIIKVMRAFGREAFMRGPDGNNSFWMKVHQELNIMGHKVTSEALQRYWDEMVARAKHAMADQTEPNEIDQCLIQFMEEVMRMKTEKITEEIDHEECTREDLKIETASDTERQNPKDDESEEAPSSSQRLSLNAEHISLLELEKKKKRTSEDVSQISSMHETIDPLSDNSSDTVELEYTFSREVFEQTEICEDKSENPNGEKEKSKEGNADGTSIIDLCSDKELDELLSGVEDNEHPWEF